MAVNVRIGQRKTIGSVKVGQTQPTLISNPNHTVKTNIAMADITDVSTANLENGFTLIYNSVTEKYEVSSIKNLAPTNITGGLF